MADIHSSIPPDGSGDGDDDGSGGGSEDPAGSAGFPIVGIGASAGGLEALEAIVGNLGLEGVALVIVQHMPESAQSHLVEILARAPATDVAWIADGMRVAPRRIYVAPPGVEVALMRGVFHVMKTAPERPRLPVDYFFRSLAQDRGAGAIGVVLSGTGSDGTLGFKAIKFVGGLTFAQDPATARYDGMPRSAIESGFADRVMPPAEIAAELRTLSAHPYLRRPARSSTLGASPEGLDKVFALLRAVTGHDLSQYKRSTIERRIERRMALHKLERLVDYVAMLQARPDEVRLLHKDLLIGVTSFFRDGEPFEAIKPLVLRRALDARRGHDPLRIWMAGCSTGEEAYSFAISVLEALGQRAREVKLQVFATDLDADAIQWARRGIYPESIALDVSPERLQRFFVKADGHYQVARRVRDMVVFATHNLTRDPPYSRLDLISCRNVMIYLQSPLQKKVLRIFHYALAPGGVLVLGTSETVGDSPDLFSLLDRKNKLYAKKDIPASATFEVTLGEAPPPPPPAEPGQRTVDMRPTFSLQQLADRKVLERYGPAGVLINEHHEVLQFRGRTGPFLEPLPGAASLSLLRLVRPELLGELRAAIRTALERGVPTHAAGIPMRSPDGPMLVDIEVLPIQEPGSNSPCLVVLFRETSREPGGPAASPSRAVVGDGGGPEVRLQELERELTATKEYLQHAVEELESANEELKSSNEELQSANEELQSTNEEIETSKEELQSANEELSTVNDELQNRMSEVSEANDDLLNVMTLVDTPLLIVGLDLRIRRFSRAAEALLSLIPGDVGRPITHLTSFFGGAQLDQVVAGVIDSMQLAQREVTASDQKRYRVSVTPYKTADRSVKGAVVTLTPLGSAPLVQSS